MNLAPKLRTYFLVDDLYHLMRGGRLKKCRDHGKFGQYQAHSLDR